MPAPDSMVFILRFLAPLEVPPFPLTALLVALMRLVLATASIAPNDVIKSAAMSAWDRVQPLARTQGIDKMTASMRWLSEPGALESYEDMGTADALWCLRWLGERIDDVEHKAGRIPGWADAADALVSLVMALAPESREADAARWPTDPEPLELRSAEPPPASCERQVACG